MTVTLGGNVAIDIDTLVKTRMLLTANSGAGKSWALRRILEQTHGKIQHLVIDLEGEFFTLREKFDYVLAGKGGDTPAEPRSAALLARRLLELNASAVVDLYELNPRDRILFVRNFVNSLVDAPKDLWHPCLVVVDEAHHFAPEDGSAESSDAIAALMSRGRKRGFAGILATQRLSKLSKDVAAEANNLVIGRMAQDVDVKRAMDSLGMGKAEAFTRLPRLSPGQFFVYGPALSPTVVEVKVGDVKTSHPQAGTMQAKAPAPRDRVLKVLSKLADLPKEAEAEARTVEELRAKIRALEAEARKKPPIPAPAESPAPVEVSVLTAADRDWLVRYAAEMNRHATRVEASKSEILRAVKDLVDGLCADADEMGAIAAAVEKMATSQRAALAPQITTKRPYQDGRRVLGGSGGAGGPARVEPPAPSDGVLDGPMQRILNAIAWLNSVGVQTPLNEAVAFVAGYAPGGGAYGNPRGRLAKMGLIEVQNGTIRLTDDGCAAAEHPREDVTVEGLHQRVLDRLDGPMQRILRPLLAAYPEGVENAALAREAGYEPNGGAYGNPRGRLKTLGLIEYKNGMAKAAPFLFFQ